MDGDEPNQEETPPPEGPESKPQDEPGETGAPPEQTPPAWGTTLPPAVRYDSLQPPPPAQPPPAGPPLPPPPGTTPPPPPGILPPPPPAAWPGQQPQWVPPPSHTWKRGQPIPLRPMRVGELIDAAIRLYRLHWAALMAIVAWVTVPFAFAQELLVNGFATRSGLSQNGFGGFQANQTEPVTPAELHSLIAPLVLVLGLTVVQLLIVRPFLTAAIVRAAAGAYLGEVPTVSSVYRFALSRWRSILWVLLLTFLAILGLYAATVVLAIGFAVAHLALLDIILVPVAIVFVFILFIRLTFGPEVVVMEDVKGTAALARSWRLSKGFAGKIFGTIFLAGILSGIVAGIIAIVPGYIAASLGSFGWVMRGAGNSLAAVVTTPFSTMMPVLLYFDLRIRKEGLDLAIMAREIQSRQP